MRHTSSPGGITLVTLTLCSLLSSIPLASATPVTAPVAGTRPNSALMADSIVARGEGLGLKAGKAAINYEHGTFQRALWNLYTDTKNATYLSWIRQGVDKVVTPNGGIIADYKPAIYELDDLRVGESIIRLWSVNKEAKYKSAAGVLAAQFKTQPRNPEGAFWHKQVYPNQQWLDGLYMGLVFYGLHAATFEPTTADKVFTDIGTQFKLMWEHCHDTKTGLLRHGWDSSKKMKWADPTTGASPEVWSRGLGWVIMALTDFLTPPLIIPTSHATYNILLTQLKSLLPALVANADPKTGAWWLVMSKPGQPKNYIETSGTAMFIYGMLKSVRLGLVPDKDGKIVATAKKAYEYLVREKLTNAAGKLSLDGTVSVGSLKGDGNYAYYVGVATAVNDLKGTAPFVMASLEYEKLKK
ncbi:glycosyl hydrolase [Venturia nashicola]|uniref:Glycosyl hydrolase n=1 Tax=Venturia nashicola TaxID=86259 RepID=A0A4Z1P2T1_9PEZI|nr:glycosyl hydrolase [Venturia nashicola]